MALLLKKVERRLAAIGNAASAEIGKHYDRG